MFVLQLTFLLPCVNEIFPHLKCPWKMSPNGLMGDLGITENLKEYWTNILTDRYVLLGSRRPSGGTAVVMEIARILLSIQKKGAIVNRLLNSNWHIYCSKNTSPVWAKYASFRIFPSSQSCSYWFWWWVLPFSRLFISLIELNVYNLPKHT